VTVSDWFGVEMLSRDHGTAHSVAEATSQVTRAGLDFASIGGTDHVEHVQSLLDDGEISIGRIEQSVRRILRLKFELGLFEDPYADPDEAAATLGSDAHREVARECVRSSLTLLQNEDETLPFNPDVDSVFVGGPNADSIANQFGGWSTVTDETPGITLREGVRRLVDDGTEVRYEQGTSITEPLDLAAATEAAASSDVAVLALGEDAYLHEFGRSETGTDSFPNRMELALPTAQHRLAEAVVETGTPTAVVMITGRPLAIERIADTVPSILMAYYPGTEGGAAIAEALFGVSNPSGALPISIPRSAGHLPTRHDYRSYPVPVEDAGMSTPEAYDPLFPFGHGRSYTEFEYDDLRVTPSETGPAGTVEVSVDVTNVGDRNGEEVVQVYANDVVSSRVTPVRELIAFERVAVPAGERRRVSLPVDAESLGVVDPDGGPTTEPGTFEVFVNELRTEFEVVSRY
jgi:beta-glucosidase